MTLIEVMKLIIPGLHNSVGIRVDVIIIIVGVWDVVNVWRAE